MELNKSQLPWRPVNSLSPASPRDGHCYMASCSYYRQKNLLFMEVPIVCLYVCVVCMSVYLHLHVQRAVFGTVLSPSLPYTLKLFLNIGLAVLSCLVSQLAPGSLGSVCPKLG